MRTYDPSETVGLFQMEELVKGVEDENNQKRQEGFHADLLFTALRQSVASLLFAREPSSCVVTKAK